MNELFFSFSSTFSSWYLTKDFQVAQCWSEKLFAHAKTCCFFKKKDKVILFELVGALYCRNINQMAKCHAYPNYDPFRRY